MTVEEFENILNVVVERLSSEVRQDRSIHAPAEFEARVRDILKEVASLQGLAVDPTFHPHAVPDMRANGFGVEVKTTTKDSWLSVGNSVFEGMRDPNVKQIYIVFGKMGGLPSVRWGRYEDRITHVRISHAPRFVLEMDREASIFAKMAISYEDFAKLSADSKMDHIRRYSRARLAPGERLWWLEDENSQGVPLKVELYMRLSKAKKAVLRAEGALLFPQIVQGGRVQDKYVDVAFFFLTYNNVFCPQTRDLYSAGSAAGPARGGNYVQRALHNIQKEMLSAAERLPSELFVEYWGADVEPQNRINEWLRRADQYAGSWTPSLELFRDVSHQT